MFDRIFVLITGLPLFSCYSRISSPKTFYCIHGWLYSVVDIVTHLGYVNLQLDSIPLCFEYCFPCCLVTIIIVFSKLYLIYCASLKILY